MDNLQKYSGIDNFRIICALLVVGIHTYPLSVINDELNFIVFHIFARVAVPFFLMATGYFIVPKYLININDVRKPTLPVNFLRKTSLIYFGASLLYLPVSIYAGYYSGNIIASIFSNILFDGMFYHLWYLPASIIGVLVLYLLAYRFSFRVIICITVFLYFIGLFRDSYYGIISGIPIIDTFYTTIFQLFSYTRNGILFAPVFLALGGWIAQTQQKQSKKMNIIGFIISLLIMSAEGILIYTCGISRHDSMYIFLLPCMYFLFCTLLQCHGRSFPAIRDVSLYIYILHPMMIVALHSGIKILGLNGLFISNNMLNFFIVSFLSILLSAVIIKVFNVYKLLRIQPPRHFVPPLQGGEFLKVVTTPVPLTTSP